MSRLPRKKSRPIKVDGCRYRYQIKGPRSVSISIQEDVSNPGQTLQCIAFPFPASKEHDGETIDLYLHDIEKIIRSGLERGWNPKDTEGSFALGNINLEEYKCQCFVIAPFGWYPNK